MGNWMATYITHPDTMPVHNTDPTFDPLYGFPNGRKTREMKVSHAEMVSCKLPHDVRGYCADKAIDILVCRKKNWPFVYKCAHEKHAYLTCEYEDYLLRMKEYEREKRLKERQKRVQG